MKKVYVLTIVLLAMVLGFVSPAMAGGDKVFACHITYMLYTEDGEPARFAGHVISIPESAVLAHCTHGNYTDHSPGRVIREADEFCFDLGLEGKAYEKCLTKFAVGEYCSRHVKNDFAVERLCGQE